ncbi:hypothetical protein IFO69_10330 [Echinicola sp. CAU 1574]|uniref:DUF3899 domain-containing protein n=1 Tax=Echinicola arenosa TaxID=2774144 RepID=A0ABR9ALC2_9BACT|nr:hypothetical protein [Echinicola arenosa]MBD8489141.1 hypothetical protein [Echinicola arenosa]
MKDLFHFSKDAKPTGISTSIKFCALGVTVLSFLVTGYQLDTRYLLGAAFLCLLAWVLEVYLVEKSKRFHHKKNGQKGKKESTHSIQELSRRLLRRHVLSFTGCFYTSICLILIIVAIVT